MIKSLNLVMVVEERDKILPSFAMRTDERVFDLFAAFESAGEIRNVSQIFHDVRNSKEKRVVESGIDTKSRLIRTVSSHESVNCFLVIVDFAEREKVPLPECLGKFSNCIAESFNRWRRYMFRCVDAETIKIEFCDEVLIGVDQNIQHRSGAVPGSDSRLAARSRVIFNYQLPLVNEITFHEAFLGQRVT